MNRKIKIITDSTADLSSELVAKMGIEVLPLKVIFENEEYRDGVDINTERLYELVETKNELPKTSAISPGEFINEFKKWIDKDYDIIYIGIGSDISGTFQSANVAKLDFPEDRIFLVDSKNLSSGIALLVLKANDFKNEGLSAKEIHEKVTNLVPKVRSQFAIQVLDYLHKGGRASGTQALVGKFLRIRPIIKVTDGLLDIYKKPMGTMKKAVDVMLDDYFDFIKNDQVDLNYIMVTHTFAEKHAIYMKDEVLAKSKPINLIESNAGCVISSHCGKGTIGILYILNDE